MASTILESLIENLVEQELEEMPIASYKTIGNFDKGSSFRSPVDRRLLTSPKAIEKITRQWEQTPYDFALYFMNDKRVNKAEFREVGNVDMNYVRNKMKLTPEEFPDPNQGEITIIFTNNTGDEWKMASGWILAHRVGHVLARSGGAVNIEWNEFTKELSNIFDRLLLDVYGIDLRAMERGKKDKVLKYVAQSLGTMKSARDSNLRNWFEFAHELLAQYMITGKITFNPLPQQIVTGLAGWGRKETRGVRDTVAQTMYNNHDLEYYTEGLQNYLDNVLDRAVGQIFVM